MDTSYNPSDLEGLPTFHSPSDIDGTGIHNPPQITTTSTTSDSHPEPKTSPFITTSRFFTPPNRLTGTSSIFSLLPTTPPPPSKSPTTPTERSTLLDPYYDSDSDDLESSYRSIPRYHDSPCPSSASGFPRSFRRNRAKSEFLRDHIGERLVRLTGWEEWRSDVVGFGVFVVVVVVVFGGVCAGVLGIVEVVGWLGGEGPGIPGEGVDG